MYKTIQTKTGRALFIILFFIVFVSSSFTQVATKYTFSQADETFTSITGGTVLWSGTFDDEVSEAITIPPFLYDGSQYTSLFVSANGFVTFGTAPAGNNYTPNSNTATYSGSVAAFGRDVNQAETGSPEVRYEQVGNEFVIQWQDVRRFNVTGEIISFQVRLNTSNNTIKVVYGGTVTPGSNTTYPQVGLRGPSNTFATNVNNRTIASAGGSWVNSGPGTLNSSTMYFNSTNPGTVPTAGLTFTWTPGNFPPFISYTPLSNTTNAGNRDLTDVTIEDYDGTVALTPFAPRVYWKVGDLGTWQSSATASVSSPYTFTIGVTGLSIGDTVFYFIIAQDDLGQIKAVPGTGLVATDVNTISAYPTAPFSYIVTLPPLAGDYTVGLPTFKLFSGKEITFEKRSRIIEVEENIIDPIKSEQTGIYEETSKGTVTIFEPANEEDLIPVKITRIIEQEYFVPILNGKEYKGSLYHEFTPEQIANYNLRAGGVYTTITEAINDVELRGVSGPVRFLLLDPTYPTETFPIEIGEIPGASSTNTVTLLPDVGVSSSISGTVTTPIFNLNNSSYFIFDGRSGGTGNSINLIIENLSTTGTNSHTIAIENGSTNNVFRYLRVNNSTQTTAGPRAFDFGTSAADPAGNSFNTIEYCYISGGRTCIGFAGTTSNPNSDNVIMGNTLTDFSFAGVWLSSNTQNTTMSRNEVFHTTAYSVANSAVNISASACLGTNNFLENKFYDLQNTSTSTLRGISGTPGEGSTLNIINNFFSITQDNGTKTSMYAIQISGTTGHTANIYYNTFRFGGVHTGGTAGVLVSGGLIKSNTGAASTFNAKNNVSVNSRTGGTAGVIHTNFFAGSAALVGTLDIDYNVWWADSSAGTFHAGWNGFVYNDQQTYRDSAAPHEQNTIFYDVEFVSNTDLHVAGSSVGDTTLAGLPLGSITTDIDGELRDGFRPYRGADEGNIPLPVELSSFNASVTGRTITLNWSTESEINNKGFEIERKINEVWEVAAFIDGKGTSSSTNHYTYNDNFDFKSIHGTISYRLKQIDFNGSFHYSNTINVDVDFTPVEYSLYQNYPNPFNPNTTIKYALPFDSNVKIGVYNLLGELITELVNTVMPAGYYDTDWNAGSIASGTYFYVIQANSIDGKNDFKTVKKMILIK